MTNQSLVKVDIGISDARSFWKLVVIPTMEEFRTWPSIHIAIALFSSLWRLHEWRWYDQHLEEDIGKSSKAEAYRDKLIEECPALGWLKDLTNISKHRALSRGRLKVKRQLEISGQTWRGRVWSECTDGSRLRETRAPCIPRRRIGALAR